MSTRDNAVVEMYDELAHRDYSHVDQHYWEDDLWREVSMQQCMDFDYRNVVLLAPMVKADLIGSRRYFNKVFNTVEYICGQGRGWGKMVFSTNAEECRRVALQLGTAEGPSAVRAAMRVCKDVGSIDINMGCPKEFSTKRGMGAALLSQPEKVADIVRTLKRNLPSEVKVSCKVRILGNSGRTDVAKSLDLLRNIESAGADAVAIHMRHPDELRYRDFPARKDAFEEVTRAANLSIPIIANGDMSDPKQFYDFHNFVRSKTSSGNISAETNNEDNMINFPWKVSGFMIGRGAMFNPSIFRSVKSILNDFENPVPLEKSIPMESKQKITSRLVKRCVALGETADVTNWYVEKSLFGRNYEDRSFLSGTEKDISVLCDRLANDPSFDCPRYCPEKWPKLAHRTEFYLEPLMSEEHQKESAQRHDSYTLIDPSPYHDEGLCLDFVAVCPPLDPDPWQERPTGHHRVLFPTLSCPVNSSYGYVLRNDLPFARKLCLLEESTLTRWEKHFKQYVKQFTRAGCPERVNKCHNCDKIDKQWLEGPPRFHHKSWYCLDCWQNWYKAVKISGSTLLCSPNAKSQQPAGSTVLIYENPFGLASEISERYSKLKPSPFPRKKPPPMSSKMKGHQFFPQTPPSMSLLGPRNITSVGT